MLHLIALRLTVPKRRAPSPTSIAAELKVPPPKNLLTGAPDDPTMPQDCNRPSNSVDSKMHTDRHTERQTRRAFLKRSLSVTAGSALSPFLVLDAATRRGRPTLPVAGVATVYRKSSHADVILGKILEGFAQDGGPGPDLELVSLYVDQFAENDMARGLATKHGFRLARTIDEAVTLGGKSVGVAAVLSIGEHGDYPAHPTTGQRMYPRKRFFDEIIRALTRGGKIVPVFNDKHLSYRTDEALEMYRTARKLDIPFMAGSSLPVAWRVPTLELPIGSELASAIAIGFGGNESYGFHALEALQCMVERRRGGESGIAAVRAARGAAVLEAEKQGYWSEPVLAAALETQGYELSGDWRSLISHKTRPFYLIDYRDGFKACVAMLGGVVTKFSFGCNLKGDETPKAARFALHYSAPFRHFEWLVKAIDHMAHTGKPAYPVERTVLTTGAINAAMQSLATDGKRIETPELDISYRATDWRHAPGEPPVSPSR